MCRRGFRLCEVQIQERLCSRFYGVFCTRVARVAIAAVAAVAVTGAALTALWILSHSACSSAFHTVVAIKVLVRQWCCVRKVGRRGIPCAGCVRGLFLRVCGAGCALAATACALTTFATRATLTARLLLNWRGVCTRIWRTEVWRQAQRHRCVFLAHAGTCGARFRIAAAAATIAAVAPISAFSRFTPFTGLARLAVRAAFCIARSTVFGVTRWTTISGAFIAAATAFIVAVAVAVTAAVTWCVTIHITMAFSVCIPVAIAGTFAVTVSATTAAAGIAIASITAGFFTARHLWRGYRDWRCHGHRRVTKPKQILEPSKKPLLLWCGRWGRAWRRCGRGSRRCRARALASAWGAGRAFWAGLDHRCRCIWEHAFDDGSLLIGGLL